VRLVTGPVRISDPVGVTTMHVETAREMLAAVEDSLPVDGAVFVAAVADWRVVEAAGQKLKKVPGDAAMPVLNLVENPDILATIGHHARRPAIVVGFAAETENLAANARLKLDRKGADIIVANDVSVASGVMGGDRNQVTVFSTEGAEQWPEITKDEVADRLARMIADRLARQSQTKR
jgi:phosphopantothenoylcysteine decarboxylase/phosphopantothenate--cysteine ligase